MLTSLVARGPLFADLRSQGVADDLVQDTLIAVTARMRQGDAIEDPYKYAARCVANLAKRTYLRRAREPAMSDETLEVLGPQIQDVAERVHQRTTMREVLDMVRSVNTVIAELTPLELELVKAELARTDQKLLAATLGISRPTLYRRKGPAIAAFVAAVAERAGTTPCADHAGALLAAAGDSGFEAAQAATAHAAGCEQCRETIRHLTVARHGLAVIAPVPLVVAQTDTAGALDRTVAALHGAVDWGKQLVLRIGDPTPLGGSATKTVAIVAAACTGGTGVYCAVEGVPGQLTAPFTHAAPKRTAPTVAGTRRPASTTGATIRPTALVVNRVTGAIAAVERQEAKARARADARALAKARAARRAQAAREFAAKNPSSNTAVKEFGTTAPVTDDAIVRQEFAAPAPAPTVAGNEFGAP